MTTPEEETALRNRAQSGWLERAQEAIGGYGSPSYDADPREPAPVRALPPYPHRGSWRHAPWCEWERGLPRPCTCGLDDARRTAAAAPREAKTDDAGASEGLREAAQQALDYFTMSAGDYFRRYGNNDDPDNVLRAALEAELDQCSVHGVDARTTMTPAVCPTCGLQWDAHTYAAALPWSPR